MTSNDKVIESLKNNFEYILSILIESYSTTKNSRGFNNAEHLLNQYYSNDPHVKPFLEYYRF